MFYFLIILGCICFFIQELNMTNKIELTTEEYLKNKIAPDLPKKLSIGYASNGQCDDLIFETVKKGLNVVIWFSVELKENEKTKKPEIFGGPDYQCVGQMVKKIRQAGYHVVHLLSVGGWNTPHPNTNFTAQEYFELWIEFNRKISDPSIGFYGFDGIDWDCEGHDDFKSPINHFTFKELDLIGELSQLLKEKGYIVSMAPSESYLDYSTNEFSLSLLHNHPEWEKEFPNFTYHGRNTYAYLLKKFGKTKKGFETFDFISVQIYEGLSHAFHKYSREGISFGKIITDLIRNFKEGYEVEFKMEKDCDIENGIIKIDPNKVVVGLANGWANGKFIFVKKQDIISGYEELKKNGLDCRGFMFWTIKEEGKVPEGETEEFYMSSVINEIFHILP